MKLKNVFALGVLGLLTLGVGVTTYAVGNNDLFKAEAAVTGEPINYSFAIADNPNVTLADSGYNDASYSFTDLSVDMTGVGSQSGTITDVPVMRNGGNTITFTSTTKQITKVQLNFKQWTNKVPSFKASCGTVNVGSKPLSFKNSIASLSIETNNTQKLPVVFESTHEGKKQVGIVSADVWYGEGGSSSGGETVDPAVREATYNVPSEYFIDDIKEASVTLNEAFSPDATVEWSVKPVDQEVILLEPSTEDKCKASIMAVSTGSATVSVTVKDGADFNETKEFPVKVLSFIDYLKDPKNIGKKVDNELIVTGIDFNRSIYVGAADGRGIQSFDKNGNLFNGLTFGDTIKIVGTIGEHGANQITPTKVTNLNKKATVTPIQLNSCSEITDNMIGDYVSLKDVTYVSKKTVTSKGNDFSEITLKDASNNTFKCHTNVKNNYIASFETFVDGLKSDEKFDFTFIADCYNGKAQFISTDSMTYEVKPVLTKDGMVIVDSLLNDIVCNDGVTPPDVGTWNAIADLYTSIPNEDKAYLKTGTYTNDNIGKALKRYDYIVAKYGENVYANFLERTITPSTASNMAIMTNSDVIITVTVVSILAITSICLLAILKRKQNVKQ